MKRAAAIFALIAGAYALAGLQDPKKPDVVQPVQVAPGVWFEQHNNIGKYGCNVSWIECDDYVVVVDTAFPLGAEEALKNIKATTGGKRVKYAVCTHYHADHTFGTGAFAKEGATIVAHENARRDYLAKNVTEYDKRAKTDQAAGRYTAYAPTLTFTDKLLLDDGKRRIEIYFFGHAHTTGDVFTYLPAEKIIFTGDACVNGPYNYCGDADTASWIQVLGRVQGLDVETVVPGHGPHAKRDLLATQKRYFQELREQIGGFVRQGKTLQEALDAADLPMWKQWTGETKMSPENVGFVYKELLGK